MSLRGRLVQLAYTLPMPLRVYSIIVVLLLCWSGFNTTAAPHAVAAPMAEQHQALGESGQLAILNDGLVEQHHLDELPSQPPCELPLETPGLLPTPMTPTCPSTAAGRWQKFVSAEPGSPFLAGPLRPPCSTTLAG